MKAKSNQSTTCDRGITLIALIITIIVLVILAAVTIRAMYNSRVVNYAINGALGYSAESKKENEIINGTENLIDSTLKRIEDIIGGKDSTEPTEPEPTPDTNQEPVFDGTPTVAKVENSNTSLTITAKATDPDGDNLAYTLCDSAGNEITTNVTQTINEAGEVVFTHSGLGNFSTHEYIVKVTDGKVAQAVPSSQCEGTTYCKGEHCDGGGTREVENSITCGNCTNRKNIYYRWRNANQKWHLFGVGYSNSL